MAAVLAIIVALLVLALLFWWQDFDGVRSAWEFRRRCQQRERRSGTEFYRLYYQHSGISPVLVLAFWEFHATYWGETPELLRPEDDLFQVNSGGDCADYANRVRERFGVTLTEKLSPEIKDALPCLDGSFDTILRIIALLQSSHT